MCVGWGLDSGHVAWPGTPLLGEMGLLAWVLLTLAEGAVKSRAGRW